MGKQDALVGDARERIYMADEKQIVQTFKSEIQAVIIRDVNKTIANIIFLV